MGLNDLAFDQLTPTPTAIDMLCAKSKVSTVVLKPEGGPIKRLLI